MIALETFPLHVASEEFSYSDTLAFSARKRSMSSRTLPSHTLRMEPKASTQWCALSVTGLGLELRQDSQAKYAPTTSIFAANPEVGT